jgi:hypothetical protein
VSSMIIGLGSALPHVALPPPLDSGVIAVDSGPYVEPLTECPYPVDRLWGVQGRDGPEFWLSFEALSVASPGEHGCLLRLSAGQDHLLRLVDPVWDGDGWVWQHGIRTRWVGRAVVIDGVPGAPWVVWP